MGLRLVVMTSTTEAAVSETPLLELPILIYPLDAATLGKVGLKG